MIAYDIKEQLTQVWNYSLTSGSLPVSNVMKSYSGLVRKFLVGLEAKYRESLCIHLPHRFSLDIFYLW